MENKLTKEYADKMADEYSKKLGGGKNIFTHGYLKAIEETNAKELLEALVEITESYKFCVKKAESSEYYIKAINAINKATK